MRARSGLALLIVVGVLGVLAVLAAAFVTMAQLERRASAQRLNATKALLLARSGIEDALARLTAGQAAEYGGENWDNDFPATLNGPEIAAEVYGPGILDVETCPVRHALRPSFFTQDIASLGADLKPAPKRLLVEGRERGYSGIFQGGDYALKVEDLNSRIHVNGGSLDAVDPDPDGPGALPADFPLNPNAATEVAPLTANGIQDFHDPSPEGPNGFLVQLLDNLDVVVTNTASPTLGAEVVGRRPPGGYPSLEALKAALGQARYDLFKAHLTLQAWVDPEVVKPQPPDIRPHRFLDIDDTHRIGTAAATIAGTPANPGILGNGSATQPWMQSITVSNSYESPRPPYPVVWERNALYAWRQLRLAPVAMEPRAPVSINSASKEVLASVFRNLKGSYLEVWDGSAGWDGGFGWFTDPILGSVNGTYNYPDAKTEEAPWHRTRLDYGMPYGTLPRPWYGPALYNPTASPSTTGGKPVIAATPLGRLRESEAISRDQALALAQAIRDRVVQKGPFKSWAEFNAFIDLLPVWEDVDGDGFLDGDGSPGIPYQVTGSGGAYRRRMYTREDADSDGVMQAQRFTAASGNWITGITWSTATGTPGLTFIQKDVLKAMANPNTDVNDFNPDANLHKEVDKTDVAGLGSVGLSPGIWQGDAKAYVHTTEFALDPPGIYRVAAAGRILGPGGRLAAGRQLSAVVRAFEIHRDTTQADFMKAFNPGDPLPLPVAALFSGPTGLYPLANGQTLVSYPEPQTLPGAPAADAAYDGQIGLGLVGALPGRNEKIRADLFISLAASAPDVNGPFQAPLLSPASAVPGNLFPDGAYSEKDAALKFPMAGNFDDIPIPYPYTGANETDVFYISAWVKPAWRPEACPRPHALISLSRGAVPVDMGLGGIFTPYSLIQGLVPLDDIGMEPVGLYFVPARNNHAQDAMATYVHWHTTTRGKVWPSRSLLWGAAHSLFATENLNRRGMLTTAAGDWKPAQTPLPATRFPVGRLEGHRWTHITVLAKTGYNSLDDGGNTWGIDNCSRMLVGRSAGSAVGGWTKGFGLYRDAVVTTHSDTSPNHLRFGETSAEHNMNYTADATFADILMGGRKVANNSTTYLPILDTYEGFFKGASSPAAAGRYLKESGATFASARLPAAASRPIRITWTEIPCDLWFDENDDGWMGDDLDGSGVIDPWEGIRNDLSGPKDPDGPNGLRDVRIDLEVWDDRGPSGPVGDVSLLGYDALMQPIRLSDPAGPNRVPVPQGRIYYKAVFVNEWDDATRLNHPLDVTPFLDDVTITYIPPGGPVILAWEEDPA